MTMWPEFLIKLQLNPWICKGNRGPRCFYFISRSFFVKVAQKTQTKPRKRWIWKANWAKRGKLVVCLQPLPDATSRSRCKQMRFARCECVNDRCRIQTKNGRHWRANTLTETHRLNISGGVRACVKTLIVFSVDYNTETDSECYWITING